MAVKIIIDAGHGGFDNGASFEGRAEKDDTLSMALAVGKILKDEGFDVLYTRTDDVYDSPIRKAQIANESGADYFVSIHRNSSPEPNKNNGVQTLIYNRGGIKEEMAKNINYELERLGYRNINVDVRPDLAVLRRTKMPAILVEVGFINNDIDNNLFDTKFNQTAKAIADGISETIIRNMADEDLGNDYVSTGAFSSGDYFEQQSIPKRKYGIAIGMFEEFGTATYFANKYNQQSFASYNKAEVINKDSLFYVTISNFKNIDDAITAERALRRSGYSTLIISEKI